MVCWRSFASTRRTAVHATNQTHQVIHQLPHARLRAHKVYAHVSHPLCLLECLSGGQECREANP